MITHSYWFHAEVTFQCSQAISGETAIVLPDFLKVLTKGTVGRDLAESLGFQLDDDKNTITSPSQITKTLENSYWVLYAFFKWDLVFPADVFSYFFVDIILFNVVCLLGLWSQALS